MSRLERIEAREYSFSVGREHSLWTFGSNSEPYRLAYSGRLLIDPATARVLKIEMVASDIPKKLGVVKLETSTEYDYLLLSGGGPYLLPVRSMLLTCRKGDIVCYRNAIEFRSYRKFETESGIRFEDPQ